MALIKQMPSKDIVDGFRGVLDFYTWCNLNIVRSWPKAPGRKRAPGVAAAGATFAYINQLASTLPEEVIEPYKELAIGTGLTWKDFLCRLYINASIEDFPVPPETIVEKEMYVYWNDDAPQVLKLDDQGASIPWTDLDLTAHTSENAKFALLVLEFTVSELGATEWTNVFFRKKGTDVNTPSWGIHPAQINWFKINECFTLAMDDARTVQYRLSLPADASGAYIWVNCLGYIE